MDDSPLISQSSSPLPIAGIDRRRHCHHKPTLHRAHTAPAITFLHSGDDAGEKPAGPKPPTVVRLAAVLLIGYLTVGGVVYYFNPEGYDGCETYRAVDALYFSIVTLCTIGYGDIHPVTPVTKILACVSVLFGLGIVDHLLSGAVTNVLDVQERIIMSSARGGAGAVSYMIDAEKGRLRIRMKVGIAVFVVFLCVGVGTVALYTLEHLDWMDSFYLSVMSVTTVGYGDKAFKTLRGRLFASFWLLVSTLAVARAFLYIAEWRIEKRNRRIAKWVLQRDLTVADLFAADINHSGFMSKSEFVLYKLKEMRTIGETDISQICKEFSKLDPNNTGKITLPDLLHSSSGR